MIPADVRGIVLAAVGTIVAGVGTRVAAQLPSFEHGTLVVLNKQAATANIIDVGSKQILATLPTGIGPHEVALSHDGRVAVTTNYGARAPGNSLTVINVPGRHVVRTIDLGRYQRPHGIAFLPGDSIAAVTSETARAIVLVRIADGTIVRTVSTEADGSHMLAMIGDGSRIYTSDGQSNSVTALSVTASDPMQAFPVPSRPEAITVTARGDEVWVGSNGEGTVSVIVTATGTVRGKLEGFGWPYRILITPDSRLAIIPDLQKHQIRIVDRASIRELAVLDMPGTGPQGVALSGDGRILYVSLSREDRVAAIDLQSYEVIGHFDTGSGPDGIAYSSMIVAQ